MFDYQQLTGCLTHLSKPRDKIAKLLAKGDIVRIRKGLTPRPPGSSQAARPGSAGQPDLRPVLYQPGVRARLPRADPGAGLGGDLGGFGAVATFETPMGTFTYQSLSLPCYAVGADLVESPAGGFLIACAEKARPTRSGPTSGSPVPGGRTSGPTWKKTCGSTWRIWRPWTAPDFRGFSRPTAPRRSTICSGS